MERQGTYKYNAFISYRHTEPDMTTAKRLQERLERFVPPRSAGEKSGERIRVFRDEDELQTSSDLSDKIKEALASSEYLIVICSPNLADSRWCVEEVRIFKELHDGTTDHMIAVVADGEVRDVLPEALTKSMREVTTETGKTVRTEVRVEPLAANVAASTPAEREKKIKREYLRVAAPLLHTSYTSLYDRYQRRRTRRLLTTGGIVLAAVAAFAVTVTTMLVQIRRQNERLVSQQIQLEEQNEVVEAQNALVEERNKQLEEQTVALSRSRSDLLAEQSLQALENHDRSMAAALALQALPDNDDPELVTAKTEYALAEAVNAYRTEERRDLPRPFKTYTARNIIREGYADSFFGHKYLALLDNADEITVWNTQTDEISCSINLAGRDPRNMILNEEGLLFVTCTWGDTAVLCYDCENGKLLWERNTFEENGRNYSFTSTRLCLSDDGKMLAASALSRPETIEISFSFQSTSAEQDTGEWRDVAVLDARTGRIITILDNVTADTVYDREDSLSGASVEHMAFSADGKKLAISTYGYDRGGYGRYGLHYGNIDSFLAVHEMESGEKVKIREPLYMIRDVAFTADGDLLALCLPDKKEFTIRNINTGTSVSDFLFEGTVSLCSFSPENGRRKWKHDMNTWSYGVDEIAAGLEVTGPDGKIHAAAGCSAGNVVDLVDSKSGKVLYHFECGSGVIETAWEALAPDRAGIHAILDNGNMARLIFWEDIEYTDESYIREYPVFPQYVHAALWLDDRIYLRTSSDPSLESTNRLLCYDWGQADQTMRATELSEDAFTYQRELYTVPDGFFYEYYEDADGGRKHKTALLDTETGKVRYRKELEQTNWYGNRLLGITEDGERMLFGRVNEEKEAMELVTVRMQDGSMEIHTIEDEEILDKVGSFGDETVLCGDTVLFFYSQLERIAPGGPIPLIETGEAEIEKNREMAEQSPQYTGEREVCICAYDLNSREIRRERHVIPELDYIHRQPVPDPTGRFLALAISRGEENEYGKYKYVLLDRESGEVTPFPREVKKAWDDYFIQPVVWKEDGSLLLAGTAEGGVAVYGSDMSIHSVIKPEGMEEIGDASFYKDLVLLTGSREGNTVLQRYTLSDGSFIGETVLRENYNATSLGIRLYSCGEDHMVIRASHECFLIHTNEWLLTAHAPDAIAYHPEKELFLMENGGLVPLHDLFELREMAEELLSP